MAKFRNDTTTIQHSPFVLPISGRMNHKMCGHMDLPHVQPLCDVDDNANNDELSDNAQNPVTTMSTWVSAVMVAEDLGRTLDN